MVEGQLPMFPEYDRERRSRLETEAITLLRDNEPEDGYALAFSGGKDSCVIKHLADKAGVKYDAHYSVTTIDPPELIRFIKREHKDVKWVRPEVNMMHAVANWPKTPPTRLARWCCDKYKEAGTMGKGALVIGVRAAESAGRAATWEPVLTSHTGPKRLRGVYVCPILYWTDTDLWSYIHSEGIKYCELYDQGFKRLGCVGCPLAGPEGQTREFARWPRFEANWRRAVEKNWENRKDCLNHRTGKPVYQAKFKTAEDFWKWWRWKQIVPNDDNCQFQALWGVAEEPEGDGDGE